MKKIATQVRDQCPACKHKFLHLIPASEDSFEALKSFKLFKILKTGLSGEIKPRSLRQLRAYWKGCGIVAEMVSDHTRQYTKDDIDFNVKISVAKQAPQLIKHWKSVDGITYMQTISIAFENMKHLVACSFFGYAFPVLAEIAGITEEELIDRIGVKRR